MKCAKINLILLVLATGLTLPQRAEAQTQTFVPISVLGNGGVASTNGNNRLVGTIGQPLIGMDSSSSNLKKKAGFWYVYNRFRQPPACLLTITSPRQSLTLMGESVLVTGNFSATGEAPPLITTITVNGVLATITGEQFIAQVPLAIGSNQLITTVEVRDSRGEVAVCNDTLTVTRTPGIAKTCVDFESLIFDTEYGGGAGQRSGEVIFAENNIPVSLQGFKEIPTGNTFFDFCRIDSTFRSFGTGQVMRIANINLKFDFTRLSTPVNRVTFDFIDLGGSENIAVNDGTVLIGNLPKGTTNIAPGVTLDVDTVHVRGGEIGKVTLIGSIKNLQIGGQEFWIDNICAQDTTLFSCQLTILSPRDGQQISTDGVAVLAQLRITGGQPPFSRTCNVNGIPASFRGDTLFTTIPLITGVNDIIATCTVVDTLGQTTSCRDSIRVTGLQFAMIDFEDLTTTGPGTGGQVKVDTQYADKGVIFNSPVALDYSKGLPIPNFARSGTIAIEQCYAQEFCTTPIGMSFPRAQRRVKVWVGYSSSLNESRMVILRALNAAGAEVGQATTTLNPSTGPQPIRIPLEITSQSRNISRATVSFSPETIFNNDLAIDDVEFDTLSTAPSCQLAILFPQDKDQICADSVIVTAVTKVTGGAPPITAVCDINGFPATLADTILTAKIPLALGSNLLTATCIFTDANGDSAVCQDSITVFRFNPQPRNIVFNEILYNPNYDDRGTERIELKNFGRERVDMSQWVLWMRRDTLNTVWVFPSGTTVAPGDLLVVQWMASGSGDNGNVFTGLAPDSDRFWGNNVASSDAMLMGGVGNRNDTPFALALLQGPVRRTDGALRDPCSMIDFVQIGGSVPDIENIARDATLWQKGDSLSFAPEGYSYEFRGNTSATDLTTSNDFFLQPSPSIGFPNVLQAPPNKHLLISEICVQPDSGEFVEIFNPMDSTVSLSDYYLTDAVNGPNNADYTRLVLNSQDSLRVFSGDFLVQFPDTAKIRPGEFQTMAISSTGFSSRYRIKPTYEILRDDPTVQDMQIVKLDRGAIDLNNANEALVLLKWVNRDSSDLVQDVDYVVWGQQSNFSSPGFARPAGGDDDDEHSEAVAAAVPPPLSVNKTGAGIDGFDRGLTRSYYDNETTNTRQIPVASQAHNEFKSWQRVLLPEVFELGEKRAGGNGISGHDETSENLALSFKEAIPTPNGTTPTDNLDGVIYDNETVKTIADNPAEDPEVEAVGFPNKVINPGEIVKITIRLQNFGDKATGPLFTILRARDLVVTMLDSTSNFPSIPPRGETRQSIDAYRFKVAKVVLPDSLRFVLFVIQKSSGPTPKSFGAEDWKSLSAVKIKKIFFSLPTSNVTFTLGASTIIRRIKPDSSVLGFSFQLTNEGEIRAPATAVKIISRDVLMETPPVMSPPPPPGNNPLDSLFIGDIDVDLTSASKTLQFILKRSFAGQLTSFDLRFTWDFGAGRDKVVFNMNFSQPDSIVIFGKVTFDDAKAIPGAVVNYVRPDPNPQPNPSNVMTLTDTTDAKGEYSFPLAFSQAQGLVCSLSVSMTQLPKDSAITKADIDSAMPLCSNSSLPPTPYRWIAANVDAIQDTVVNAQDCMLILDKVCCPNKDLWNPDWVFVDASYPIKHTNWQRAPQRVLLNLGNYNVVVNFIGIILGDVDGGRDGDPQDKPISCNSQNCGSANGTQ